MDAMASAGEGQGTSGVLSRLEGVISRSQFVRKVSEGHITPAKSAAIRDDFAAAVGAELDSLLFTSQMTKAALAAAKPPAAVCGKVTEDGETVFSCLDCGADPTCIMCSSCFERSEHRFHNYQMAQSGGSGYCDCGDEEAWSSGHACDAHGTDSQPIRPLPDGFAQHATTLITAATTDAIRLLQKTSFTAVEARPVLAHPDLPGGRRGSGASAAAGVFCVMLHNDAAHSFDQAIRAVRAAVRCSAADAEAFANDAHRNGRSMVFGGSKSECSLVQRTLAAQGFGTMVHRAQVLSEQLLLSRVFGWLAEVTEMHPALREACVTVLLDQGDGPTPGALATVFQAWATLPERDRECLRDAVLSPLLLSPEWKLAFGLELFRQYPTVAMEGDEQDNALGLWTVQVFTVPSVARTLVLQHDAVNYLVTLIRDIVAGACTRAGVVDLGPDEGPLSAESPEYARPIHDLRYLLENSDEPSAIRKSAPTAIEILGFLQGMDAVQRKFGDHVELEDQAWIRAIILYSTLATKLTKYIVAGHAGADTAIWTELVDQTVAAIAHSRAVAVGYRTVPCDTGAHEMIEFDFDSTAVSMYQPLHRLLAATLRAFPENPVEALQRCIRERTWEAETVRTNIVFSVVHLLEAPLRCFVYSAKAKRGFMVRNGSGVPNLMANIHRPDTLLEETVDADLALLQLGAASLASPAHFLRLLLSRFGIAGWFDSVGPRGNGALKEDPKSGARKGRAEDKGEKVIELAEDALRLLYAVVHRRTPGVGETTLAAAARAEVVHILCEGRTSFSQLQKRIPPSMEEPTLLEAVLKDVATRADDGAFLIRKEVACAEFDPCFFHHTDAQRVKAVEAVTRLRGNPAAAFAPAPPPPPATPSFALLEHILPDPATLGCLGAVLGRAAGGWASEGDTEGGSGWLEDKSEVSEGVVWTAFHLVVLGLQDTTAPAFASALATAPLPGVTGVTSGSVTPSPAGAGTVLGAIARLKTSTLWLGDKGTPRFGFVAEWVIARLQTSHADAPGVRSGLAAAGVAVKPPLAGTGEAESGAAAEAGGATPEAAAREKRRAKAKARQAKIMAQFKSKQTAFADKHSDAMEEVERTPTDASTVSAASTLEDDVTCQTCLDDMDLDTIEASGVVLFGHVQGSHAYGDPEYRGPHTSVCGHGMHIACFDDWKRSKIRTILNQPYLTVERVAARDRFIDFPCPLCQRVCNVVIPVIPAAHAALGPTSTADADAEAPPGSVTPKGTLVGDVVAAVDALRGSPPEADLGMVIEDKDVLSMVSGELSFRRKLSPELTAAMAGYFGTDDDFGAAVIDLLQEVTCTVQPSPTLGIPLQLDGLARHLRSTALGMASAETLRFGAARGMLALGRMLLVLVRTSAALCDGAAYTTLRAALGEALTPPPLPTDVPQSERAASGGHHPAAMETDSMDPIASRGGTRSGSVGAASAAAAGQGTRDTAAIGLHLGSVDPALLFAAGVGAAAWRGGPDAVRSLGRLCATSALCQAALRLRQNASAGETPDASGGFDADCSVGAMLSGLLGFGVTEDQEDLVLDAATPVLRAIALMQSAVLGEASPLPSLIDLDALVALFHFPSLEDYCADPTTIPRDSSSPPGGFPGGDVGPAAIVAHWFGPMLRGGASAEPEAPQAAGDAAAGTGAPQLAPAPTLRTLIDLPREYWEVIRKCQDAVCPVSGDAVSDPAMCLLCGEVLCCQCLACQTRIMVFGTEKKRGACNAHAARCNGGLGMFMDVKNCAVVLLDGDRGAQLPAPYVDAHGETDLGLKRGRPLFLNQGGYGKLVKMFQAHGIPAAIARSLLKDGLTQPAYFRAM